MGRLTGSRTLCVGAGFFTTDSASKYALIRRPAHFHTPGDVGQSLAHGDPPQADLAFPGPLPKYMEHSGIVDRRLDPEYRPLFVVHLDRIAVDPVLDPNSFGSIQITGRDLAAEPRVDATAQESQYVLTS